MGERQNLMQQINEKIQRISQRADAVETFAANNNQNLANITQGIKAARAQIGQLQGKIAQTLEKLTQIVQDVNEALTGADNKLNTEAITNALLFDSKDLARDVTALNDQLAIIEQYLDRLGQGGAGEGPGGPPPGSADEGDIARAQGDILRGETPGQGGQGGGKRKKKGGYKYSIKKTHKRKKHTPNAGKKKTRSHKKRN